MASRSIPTPAPVLEAVADFQASLQKRGQSLNPLTASWKELETALTGYLGGGFDARNVEHRRISLSLGAVVGERLKQDTGAFWFAQRDTFGALGLGFPDTVFTVSPFTVATLALIAGKVGEIGSTLESIRQDHAAAKAREPSPRPLAPHDYHRFFDPGFIEFFVLDVPRAEKAWNLPPMRLIGELKDAQFRAQGLSREGKAALESQLIAPLQGLEPLRPLFEQADRAPRVVEAVAHLWGAIYGTGVTTEEGWNDVAARILQIGSLMNPPVLPVAIDAVKKGAGPVTTWLRHVPARPGVPTSGILGIFPDTAVRAIHPSFAQVPLRVSAVDPSALLPLLQKYDAKNTRASVQAYAEALTRAGAKPTPNPKDSALLDEALSFLDKLRDTLALAIKDQKSFCIRRLTESEASESSKFGPMRAAVQS